MGHLCQENQVENPHDGGLDRLDEAVVWDPCGNHANDELEETEIERTTTMTSQQNLLLETGNAMLDEVVARVVLDHYDSSESIEM